MNDVTLSPDECGEINRLIDLFISGDICDPHPDRCASERLAVARTSVLPALEDWSAFGGISRDAQIMWVDREPLSSLSPIRPNGARDCHWCDGSGRVSFGSAQVVFEIGGRKRRVRELEDHFVCYCGGLGWLLPGEIRFQDLE